MAITYVLYAVLVVATLVTGYFVFFRITPRIEEAAGGRTILDARIGGYSFEEVKTFLNALTPEAAKTYLGLAIRWDMVFALFFGATISLAIQWATPDTFPVPPAVMALAVLPAVVLDMRENAFVAAMLTGGPEDLKADLVRRSCFCTRWKWRLAGLATGILAVMVVVRFVWPTSSGMTS